MMDQKSGVVARREVMTSANFWRFQGKCIVFCSKDSILQTSCFMWIWIYIFVDTQMLSTLIPSLFPQDRSHVHCLLLHLAEAFYFIFFNFVINARAIVFKW